MVGAYQLLFYLEIHSVHIAASRNWLLVLHFFNNCAQEFAIIHAVENELHCFPSFENIKFRNSILPMLFSCKLRSKVLHHLLDLFWITLSKSSHIYIHFVSFGDLAGLFKLAWKEWLAIGCRSQLRCNTVTLTYYKLSIYFNWIFVGICKLRTKS